MFGCWGNATGSIWAWWWIIPMIMFIICMSMCLFGRRKMGGRYCCFPKSNGDYDGDTARKEIIELREEIEKLKKK
ncbi:MAG: hypothetical protein CSYNP_00841 [Syntrophus sp. SKADARSKE-3]|nr:hypothetical protein [Syntrophus sp. SKADARSKE-3]